MVHLYPQPDAQGLAKTKEFYFNRLGRTLTDEEAYEALNSVMRFLYLQSLPPDVLPEEPDSDGEETLLGSRRSHRTPRKNSDPRKMLPCFATPCTPGSPTSAAK